MKRFTWLLVPFCLLLTQCNSSDQQPTAIETTPIQVACDPDNGGLMLPAGFCAYTVIDTLGLGRHITVRDNGDLYVALRGADDNRGIVALRDTTGDGRPDVVARFGSSGGTGIEFRDGYLYFASLTEVMRYRIQDDELTPSAPRELLITFPEQRVHADKTFTFDDQGRILVNVGAPANACMEEIFTLESPGRDPCPLLDNHAGIWRFDPNTQNQTHGTDGFHYATGIRNSLALDWHPVVNKLYVVQHGRDQLDALWPKVFTAEQNTNQPAESFFMVDEGDVFGWPYCYYDADIAMNVTNPEYGGDGRKSSRCTDYELPIFAFPAHWAPNDMVFYSGTHFPAHYLGGAFVAFHGSWNRAPSLQGGYNIIFVPFEGDLPSGPQEVFADSFAGTAEIATPADAQHRPTGVAQGPEGSLYVTDSKKGRVWRIVYQGS